MDGVVALSYDNRINAGEAFFFFFFCTFEVEENRRIPRKNRQQPQSVNLSHRRCFYKRIKIGQSGV